jgi:nucleoside-diphosphate-sugar epimerase
MIKILITGADGFIGRACLDALQCRGDYEIHALSLSPPHEPQGGVTWHAVDLLDPITAVELVREIGASHLLHLAWYAEPGKFWEARENYQWVSASMRLIEAFSQGGGRRAVFAGSCAEYDFRYGYCNEMLTPLRPNTTYGACKHALQTMVDAYCRQNNINYAWGRIFFIFGEQEHSSRLVGSVVKALRSGQRARVTHGSQIRDFLHVSDVAEGLVELVATDVSGPLNVASGQAVTVKEIVERLAVMLGGSDLVDFGALPASSEEPPLIVGDASLMLSKTKWSPRLTLEQGLGRVVDYWRAQEL